MCLYKSYQGGIEISKKKLLTRIQYLCINHTKMELKYVGRFKQFEKRFSEWMKEVTKTSEGTIAENHIKNTN